jgi:hypothetical protein
VKRLAYLVLITACTSPVDTVEQGLSGAAKQQRLELIRDSAAQMGVYNAALFAGIAMSESSLAHCYSEATFTCPGPASPSCAGGPVIAGAADGPCADMQGGLGMFQFDAGTYAQTVAAYGEQILTVEGNTAQAVSFVIDRLKQDIAVVDDWKSAVAYLNQVPLTAGDPTTEEWSHFLACRYNGCCSGAALCTTRANGYRDNAINLYAEQGGAFWRTRDRCRAIPAGDVIDQRSECYVAGGDPRYWHPETVGYGDNREWTNSTASATASNFAQWIVVAPAAGRYHLEAYAEGGEATAATYTIVHAGITDTVTLDQSAVTGFAVLGDFDFAVDGNEYVELGDNTGTAQQKLVFDGLRVTSLDGPGPGIGDGGGGDGGCAAGGGEGGGAGVLLALALRRGRKKSGGSG